MAVENRGPHLLVVCAIMVSLAFISTTLRCYVRLRLVKAFGVDDMFMVVATLTHIMFATCAIGGIHYGTGRHMWDLEDEDAMKALRYWWLCYVAYCLTMIAAKISIGLFLLRLTIHRIHVWIIYITMALTVICGTVFFFVTLFQCSPISYFWTRMVGESGTCINVDIIMGLTYLYGSISAINDFTFGILPIFLVWNLNMERRIKVALIPVLSMACIASSAVLVRMAYIKDFKSDDFLYATVDIAIWSDTEQGLAITAGSLATLRPLFKLVSSKITTRYGTPSGLKTGEPKPQTVWPSQNSGRNRSKGGPWSLLQTEAADKDVELANISEEANISKMSVSVAVTGKGESDDERSQKGWWSATERERRHRGDNESEQELNVLDAGATKREPGGFV